MTENNKQIADYQQRLEKIVSESIISEGALNLLREEPESEYDVCVLASKEIDRLREENIRLSWIIDSMDRR